MATFVPGQRIATSVPRITVDAGLRAGRHRFSLVVVDSDGNASQPDLVTVEVRQTIVPVGTPRRRSASKTTRTPRKTPRSPR